MALSILNNIPSLMAQNELAITNSNLQKTLFQLASGSRINTGADDAAGLAIANGLQANIMALQQSTNNANNATGNLQVADGALGQVTTLLDRAVTLATEASNSGLTTQQASALDNEFTSIKSEIDQIGSTTTFNGAAVFTVTPVAAFMSDGTAAGTPTTPISVSPGVLSSAAIGLEGAASGTLSAVSNFAASDTVTVGSTAFTFVATLPTTGGAGDVLIGATTAASLQNLAEAINGGPGAGTAYIASATSPGVTATALGTSSLTVIANQSGTGGNSIATTSTATGATWGATTLTGGAAATSLLSTTSAQSALTAITNAVAGIAATRGGLGAGINRLQAAVNVANVQVQNVTSSEDSITAADIPTLVANLNKYNILEQTGIAALAQANTNQQAVLKLLG